MLQPEGILEARLQRPLDVEIFRRLGFGSEVSHHLKLPEISRTYRNHHLDSTLWREYEPRPGDVIVTTSYKSGTTFTQQILT